MWSRYIDLTDLNSSQRHDGCAQHLMALPGLPTSGGPAPGTGEVGPGVSETNDEEDHARQLRAIRDVWGDDDKDE